MTEFMGMVWGEYDAKKQKGPKEGFVPGGASLHSCMSPHGPDKTTFEKASAAKLDPVRFDKGLAFMFESSCVGSGVRWGWARQPLSAPDTIACTLSQRIHAPPSL